MKIQRYRNRNIIKHNYKYTYQNADQIQLQKLHATISITLINLEPGQLFKGCFINGGAQQNVHQQPVQQLQHQW